MKVKRICIDKIPSSVKNLGVGRKVEYADEIESKSGNVLVVKVVKHLGYYNEEFELKDGRQIKLYSNDVILGVLGERRATAIFGGTIPKKIKVGDVLSLICPGGIIGELTSVNKNWKPPVPVKVLGSLVMNDKLVNIKDSCIPSRRTLKESAPILCVSGTCMDSGKTTILCEKINFLKQRGKKVVAAKLTGVHYCSDMLKAKDAGADEVFIFSEAGLPSTCVISPRKVLNSALGLLYEANTYNPDVIAIELGDSIHGEYNVNTLLEAKEFNRHIKFNMVACIDYMGFWGVKEYFENLKMPIDAVSGIITNSQAAKDYIRENTGIETSHNFEPKDIRSSNQLMFDKLFNSSVS